MRYDGDDSDDGDDGDGGDDGGGDNDDNGSYVLSVLVYGFGVVVLFSASRC